MEDTITGLIEDVPGLSSLIKSKLSLMKSEVRAIMSAMIRVKKISLPNLDNYVQVTEFYRWESQVDLHCVYVILSTVN